MARSTALGAADVVPAPGTRTVAALWRDAIARAPAGAAYLVETREGWQAVSWQDVAARVDDVAHGLLAHGVRRGEPVAILGSTRLEWIVFDVALALVGAIGVPIYPASSAAEARHVMAHSGAVGLLVEGDEELAELGELPSLNFVIRFTDLDLVAAEGRAHAAAHPRALDEAAAAISDDDVFTYQFTSGTTGPPKGCVILNRHYVEMTRCVVRLPRLVSEADVVLLFLPLAHNFGRLLYLAGVEVGFTTALLPDPRRVRDVLGSVRPTILPSVPRVYEKMHAAILDRFEAARGPRRWLIRWAVGLGRRTSAARLRGEPLPPLLATQHRLASRLVYRKVRDGVGGRLRLAVSGGAPLATEIAEFFHALDILILEGYGQSECTTACTFNRPGAVRFGTVGPPLPGFEVRIADDSEVLVRGPTVFAGYLHDEEATREVLDKDGWLHTGDIGELDSDGFLTITDRKRDLIVTAGAKNVSPQNLEHALTANRLIADAVVVGDRRPYLAALLTLDEDEARAWALRNGREGGLASLAADDELRAELQEAVDRVNADASRHARIRRFAVLERAFSAEADEITPTLKLKRRVIEQNFEREIDELYAER